MEVSEPAMVLEIVVTVSCELDLLFLLSFFFIFIFELFLISEEDSAGETGTEMCDFSLFTVVEFLGVPVVLVVSLLLRSVALSNELDLSSNKPASMVVLGSSCFLSFVNRSLAHLAASSAFFVASLTSAMENTSFSSTELSV